MSTSPAVAALQDEQLNRINPAIVEAGPRLVQWRRRESCPATPVGGVSAKDLAGQTLEHAAVYEQLAQREHQTNTQAAIR